MSRQSLFHKEIQMKNRRLSIGRFGFMSRMYNADNKQLQVYGINKVIRIPNNEIAHSLVGVIEYLKA